MNIEELIQQNTKALIENTAALREILSVGAVTAADTLVPTTPKKRASKAPEVVEPEPQTATEPVVGKAPFGVIQHDDGSVTVEPEPTPEPEPVEETPQVPDLPVAELRAQLKEVIKGKLLADTEGTVKATFDALRAKYGVAVIKELTDDQVAPFYGEVLTWG
jgi:hypothetical protein